MCANTRQNEATNDGQMPPTLKATTRQAGAARQAGNAERESATVTQGTQQNQVKQRERDIRAAADAALDGGGTANQRKGQQCETQAGPAMKQTCKLKSQTQSPKTEGHSSKAA